MNQKELMRRRNDTARLYHFPGCPNMRCPRNMLAINVGNSLEHEEAKFSAAYDLMKKGHEIITEAVEEATGERADLVDLDDGQRYEFETDPKRAERFKERKEISVVMVGRYLNGTSLGSKTVDL